MSQNCRLNRHVLVERINPSRKVLYHFAIRAIINEILMIKDRSEDRPIRACHEAVGLRWAGRSLGYVRATRITLEIRAEFSFDFNLSWERSSHRFAACQSIALCWEVSSRRALDCGKYMHGLADLLSLISQ